MASASSTSAKNLFVDSKRRLGERVHVNLNNMASVCRQTLRGSQSADLLSKAARNMAMQDSALESTRDNIQKLQVLATHLSYQQEAIERSTASLPEVREQRTAELSDRQNKWTLRSLLAWLRTDSGWVTGKEDLFFSGDSVRNGIMVLVNDTDWELLGEIEYELQDDDCIVFISTLHGG